MKPFRGSFEVFESLPSTQELLCSYVREGRTDVGAVLALEQTAGRGRMGRSWFSPAGTSLSISMALFEYADWPQPQFIGMAVAIAAAGALDCLLAWPNDLMMDQGMPLKVGGVLSEMVKTPDGHRMPVVGIGANLTVREFPSEIAETAGSLGVLRSPAEVAGMVLDELVGVPEPQAWSALAPFWMGRDRTPGKCYRLPDGRTATATGIDEEGRLMAEVDGTLIVVPSAGPTT